MDRDWSASFSIRFRNGTCIIILDKKYNIANSSCHFGSYGSIWTGPSPKKYYMDLTFGPYNILPYDPQCHELFAMYIIPRKPSTCPKSLKPYHIWLHQTCDSNFSDDVYGFNRSIFNNHVIVATMQVII